MHMQLAEIQISQRIGAGISGGLRRRNDKGGFVFRFCSLLHLEKLRIAHNRCQQTVLDVEIAGTENCKDSQSYPIEPTHGLFPPPLTFYPAHHDTRRLARSE